MSKTISMSVVNRLPRYYRYLGGLLDMGVTRTSSSELSDLMDITASQIRQDFSNFGSFGQQGYGYNVEMLMGKIGNILGLERVYRLVIIGAGHLGQALANNSRFTRRGFQFIGLFDIDPSLVGKEIAGLKIRHMDEFGAFTAANKTDIAVLTAPGESAQEVFKAVSMSGIKGVWNFTNLDLRSSGDIKVQSVHLTDSLMTLAYMLNEKIE